MKKIITATLLATTVFSLPFAFSEVGAASSEDCKKSDKGVISVSYTAEKEVLPDTVEISIAVKTENSRSMQEAASKNKEISDKVYAYLKSVIDSANGDYIKTSNYSARPNYVYSSGKRYLDKYEVSNNIIVHTKSIDKITTMIDKSLTLGATNVDSLNFSLSEKDAQCAELLSTATKQVRNRANIVAKAAETCVVGIKSIDTSCTVNRQGGMNYMRNSLMVAKSAGVAEDAATIESAVIEAGVIKIYSNVNGTFYVK